MADVQLQSVTVATRLRKIILYFIIANVSFFLGAAVGGGYLVYSLAKIIACK